MPVTIMADSGASINILDEKELSQAWTEQYEKLRLPVKSSPSRPWKIQYQAWVGDEEDARQVLCGEGIQWRSAQLEDFARA